MSERTQSQRWLFGPAPDLLLGCGIGYAALVIGFALAGIEDEAIGVLGLVPLVSILTGTPHYGATLLRVYEQREERRAYAFFAVWVTAAVWALFYAGLYSYALGSLLLTVYLSWSPWHYTGQNYGIAVMFLRRRGVPFSPRAKRMLYLSFLLSFALTLLALHGGQAGGEYASVQPYPGGSFRMLRIGIPYRAWACAFGVVGVAYLGTLLAAGAMLLRCARPRELVPVAALVLTQALWFSLPTALRIWGAIGPGAALDTRLTAYAFFWVATGHSVQYLWITSYYAAGRATPAERWRYLGKTLAAGSFIWGVPGLLYGLALEGGPLGGLARDLDVFVLLGSVVNLHHFLLDGAIWKLRDGRVARILIRRPVAADAAPVPPLGRPRRRWLAPLVYALGTAATVQVLVALGERVLRFEPALRTGDALAAWRSLQRLDRIHSDSASDYLRYGKTAAAQGNALAAGLAYHRSLEMRPSAAGYVALGGFAEQQRDAREAVASYERALVLSPDDPQALYGLGSVWLQLDDPERAEVPLARAAALFPDDPVVRATLQHARQRLAERSADTRQQSAQ